MSNKETVMTASKKVNVSINPETMAQLTNMKAKIAEGLGFTPSYSEVIQYLIKHHKPEQTDILS
jgi:predicted CopG family antitoxin